MALQDITQGFGVVTVINARCVPIADFMVGKTEQYAGGWTQYCRENTAMNIAYTVEKYALDNPDKCCYIDSLKIANITMEGPTKTIIGGQYASPLIKFGKTATCEMQDALGNPKALEILGGVTLDATKQMHFTSKFGAPVCIIGDTFIIDRITGEQVPIKEILYQFIPDSIINLTQDAEGDATVFDLNGSLVATDIKETTAGSSLLYGTFYSILDGTLRQDTSPEVGA